MKLKTLLAVMAATSLGAATATAQSLYLDRAAWTWSTSSDCTVYEDDIRGIAAIADGDSNTCWHSNWHAPSGTAERSNPHWVMIDRGKDATPFYGIAYLPRQSTPNQACTQWSLYLSDTPFGDVDATSSATIEAALGQPDYAGAWDGDVTLKTATFARSAKTSRYLLFVNLASHSSSSAACAEFNLLTQYGADNAGSGTIPTPPTSTFNALKITTIAGEQHRIALDGRNLTVSMSNGSVRLSNTGITVEYTPSEVESYSFEQFSFPATDPYYQGTKSDVLTPRFDMSVSPADGSEVGILSEICLTPPAGALPQVNSSCALPVTLSRHTSNSTKVVLSVAPGQLASMADENAGCYRITGFEESKAQTYELSVPADLFVDSDGALSNALTATWTVTGIPEQSGIDEIEAPDNSATTLIIKREGDCLTLRGISRGSSVALVNTAGTTVAKSPVSARGTASLAIGQLPKGVYLLTANSTTLKIII